MRVTIAPRHVGLASSLADATGKTVTWPEF